MAQFTLLIADNDAGYLETIRVFFEKARFVVRTAPNPDEAKAALERGGIDLAILDIRLVNNRNEKDFSGVPIARTVAPEVPKILLTKWLTYDAALETPGLSPDGMSRPVACVDKKPGLPALLAAVMDRYHRELLEARGLKILLDACGELPAGGMREQCRERVINTATASWLGAKPVKPLLLAKQSANQERNNEKETVGRGQ